LAPAAHSCSRARRSSAPSRAAPPAGSPNRLRAPSRRAFRGVWRLREQAEPACAFVEDTSGGCLRPARAPAEPVVIPENRFGGPEVLDGTPAASDVPVNERDRAQATLASARLAVLAAWIRESRSCDRALGWRRPGRCRARRSATPSARLRGVWGQRVRLARRERARGAAADRCRRTWWGAAAKPLRPNSWRRSSAAAVRPTSSAS
jgi:hypothetical protein